MYLQLAEYRTPSSNNPFIFIPDTSGQSKGMYVREDYFDSLTDDDFNRMMRKLAPFQPEVNTGQMSEGRFLASRASRKKAREEKKTKKEETKQKNKDRRAETISNLVQTVGGVASSIFGKKVESAPAPESLEPEGQTEPTPLYKNPLVLIAGAGLLGAGIYFATRPK